MPEQFMSVRFELTTTTLTDCGEYHTSHVEKVCATRAEMVAYLKGVIADAESDDEDDETDDAA
jgi:hypothetical protein